MKKYILKAVFAGLLFIGFTSASAQPVDKEIGIVSYTFRNSFSKDFVLTLDSIQALGLKYIEFSNLFGKTAEEVRALLDARGMACPSFGTSYDDLVNKTDEVASKAKTLGARYVRVAWIPHEGPLTIEHVRKAIIDFNKAGKILKETYGLTFCYHNHGYEFQPYESGTMFDYMMRETNPDFVSVELDVFWVLHPGHDPATLLRKYGDRIKLMHVKDLKKGVQGDYSGATALTNDVVVGTGQLNLKEIFEAARKSAVEYYLIEDESPLASKQVPESITNIKEALTSILR